MYFMYFIIFYFLKVWKMSDPLPGVEFVALFLTGSINPQVGLEIQKLADFYYMNSPWVGKLHNAEQAARYNGIINIKYMYYVCI